MVDFPEISTSRFEFHGLARGYLHGFREMSRNDIVRNLGATIWTRTGVLQHVLDPEIKVSIEKNEDKIITRYNTK